MTPSQVTLHIYLLVRSIKGIGAIEDANSPTKNLIEERNPKSPLLKARNFAELLQERMATHHWTIDSLAPTNAGYRRYGNVYRRL
jgi:hypothetical protein